LGFERHIKGSEKLVFMFASLVIKRQSNTGRWMEIATGFISWEMGLRNGDVLQCIKLLIPFYCLFFALNSCCLFYDTSVCQSRIESPLLVKRESTARKVVGSEPGLKGN